MITISNTVVDASSSSSDDRNASSSSPVPITKNETRPLSSLTIDLSTRSTIYKRHEARLSRSYALRDDPRPVLIRVMSGLPGFRTIFPPYRSESQKLFDKLHEQQRQQRQMSTTKVDNGEYSEETLFNPYSEATDNTVRAASTENIDTASCYAPIGQVMFATGFCSGSAEFIFAYGRSGNLNYATMSSGSPFQNVPKNSKAMNQHFPLFFRGNVGGPEIYNGYVANNNTVLETTNNTRPSAGAFSKALSAALPISVLFGAKVFMDSVLEIQENDNTSKHKNSPSIAYGMLSSAFAGGVVGSSRLVLSRVKNGQQSQLSYLSVMDQQRLASGYASSLIGRHVAAAILYFSVYDGLSSMFSTSSAKHLDAGAFSSSIQSDSKKKGTLGIVVGGAFAGIAHTAAMNSHLYGYYGSMIWWSRIMLPALSRAAPIHALVFYGYEKMKESAEAN